MRPGKKHTGEDEGTRSLLIAGYRAGGRSKVSLRRLSMCLPTIMRDVDDHSNVGINDHSNVGIDVSPR